MSGPERPTVKEAMTVIRRESSPRIRAAIAARDRRIAAREAAYQRDTVMRDRAGNLMADWREAAMVEIPRPGEFPRPVTTGQQLVLTTEGGERFLVTFQYLGQVKP